MIRVEENEKLIRRIDEDAFCLPTITDHILMDISKSLAIIADSMSREDIPGTLNGHIYKCPCGLSWDIGKAIRYHYCPNCGRKSGR